MQLVFTAAVADFSKLIIYDKLVDSGSSPNKAPFCVYLLITFSGMIALLDRHEKFALCDFIKPCSAGRMHWFIHFYAKASGSGGRLD